MTGGPTPTPAEARLAGQLEALFDVVGRIAFTALDGRDDAHYLEEKARDLARAADRVADCLEAGRDEVGGHTVRVGVVARLAADLVRRQPAGRLLFPRAGDGVR